MQKRKMKSLFVGIVLLFSITEVHALSLSPVSSLSDWTAVPAGKFNFSGNTATISTTGKASIHKEYSGGTGIISTVNIESASGNASAGLAMEAGSVGAYRVHVNLGLMKQTESHYTLYYQIQLRDADGNTVNELAYGMQTREISNPDIVIGIARVDNEIWIYGDNFSLTKWDPLTIMNNTNGKFWLWGGTDQISGSSINARFSAPYIINP
ncbi:MAG: hypothetical protein V2I97_02030 [Desulfococcaceae bacterium]|jgi:hypothetical protein|nr:hypothetical protein [Desulfococcaceae bacterium]